MKNQTSESVSSFREIVKATSVFGGVQVYQILIGIIKSKVIAVLLGPTGIGIQGLFTTSTDLIKNISSLGLSQSAVKDVAEANSTNDHHKVSYTATVLKKLVWVTGLIGMVIVMVSSPLLSRFTFGNYDYTIPFIFLSVTLLFDQLSSGNIVLLQGLRRIKLLAKATALGSTAGLLVSVPLYYLLGVSGIVPTIILCSLTELVLVWFFARKVKLDPVDLTYKDAFHHGVGMLQMGAAMCTNAVLATLSAFLLKSFIRSLGGTEDVGLYQAAFILTTTYANLVTNAIATDYYPRLTASNKNNDECRRIVCSQGEIAVLLLSPLLNILVLFVPLFIKILYSDDFLDIRFFVIIAALGLMMRLGSWLLTYLLLSKGETKTFLTCEVTVKALTLAMNLLGYYLGGMLGLGIAFSVSFIFYFILLTIVAKKKYSFVWTGSFSKLFFYHIGILICCIGVCLIFDSTLKYVLGGLFAVTSIVLSVYGLENRIGLKQFFQSRIKK